MPNTKSAAKRLKTSLKSRSLNNFRKKQMRTAKKEFFKVLEQQNLEAAETALNVCFSALDKAAKRNTITKNKVARDKSRLAARLNAARATA